MTVGIAGSQARIGTTTQALQMILNLKALEYDAAYVEMGQQYLKKLQELEKEDIVKKEHCISFMDVDLYSRYRS